MVPKGSKVLRNKASLSSLSWLAGSGIWVLQRSVLFLYPFPMPSFESHYIKSKPALGWEDVFISLNHKNDNPEFQSGSWDGIEGGIRALLRGSHIGPHCYHFHVHQPNSNWCAFAYIHMPQDAQPPQHILPLTQEIGDTRALPSSKGQLN